MDEKLAIFGPGLMIGSVITNEGFQLQHGESFASSRLLPPRPRGGRNFYPGKRGGSGDFTRPFVYGRLR